MYLSSSVTEVWGRTLGIKRENNSGFNVAYSEKINVMKKSFVIWQNYE
jgi:hypothetical protein